MNPKSIQANASDAGLNAAVAEHVVGYHDIRWIEGKPYGLKTAQHDVWRDIPPYATSADVVIELVDRFVAAKSEYIRISPGYQWRVDLFKSLDDREPAGWGLAPTFARAACIALLRAHGVEVVES